MLYFFPLSKEPFLYPFKQNAGVKKSPLLLLATEQKQYKLARLFKEGETLTWKDLDGNTFDPQDFEVWAPLGDYHGTQGVSSPTEFESDELMDEDGYPTEFALWTIQNFDFANPTGLFDLIEKLWHLKSFGFHREDLLDDTEGRSKIGEKIFLSTAGWSGNEALIDAMQKNILLWQMTWKVSRIGGHYEFEVKHEDA